MTNPAPHQDPLLSALSTGGFHDPPTLEIIRGFLQRGCNPNAKNQYSQTPLHLAIQQSLSDIAICLLEHGAEPESKALEEAVRSSLTGVVQALLQRHAKLPENILQKCSDIEIAKLLLQYGANPYQMRNQLSYTYTGNSTSGFGMFHELKQLCEEFIKQNVQLPGQYIFIFCIIFIFYTLFS